MIDKKGFCKIFDINVPDYEHFDYYIDQLSKTHRNKDIKNIVLLYEKAEEEIGDLYNFRMKKANEIIEFLRNSKAYNELVLDNLIMDYPVSKSFSFEEDKKYISIDIKQANWTILKKYDSPFDCELPNTYEEILDKFQMPEIFKKSKSLRQFIFGNINPKRQSKAQRAMIQTIILQIGDRLKLECIRHDEVVYSYIGDVTDIIKEIDDKFRIKLFSSQHIEDFRIDTVVDENNCILYREMVGFDGNRFYILLKKYILNESLDIRDLYFKVNGHMAIWKTDEINIKIS
jgi:hypothetical protein